MNITILQPQWYDGIVATSLNREEITALILSKMYSAALDENNTVSFSGYLYSSTGKWSYAEYLMQLFNNLTIDIPTSGRYIDFADPEVERILKANNIGDGVGITLNEASNVGLTLGGYYLSMFKENDVITSFNELSNFSYTVIAEACFLKCYSLLQIDLTNITNIKDYGLSLCTALTNVGSLLNLRLIGTRGFAYTYNLAMDIDLNLTSLNTGAFYKSGITKLKISGSISSIPNAGSDPETRAFGGCTSLTEVDLSTTTSLISIGTASFVGCSALTLVKLPSSITSIGGWAFAGSQLTIQARTYYIYATTPPTLNARHSIGTEGSSVVLPAAIYVPAGSVEDYKAASIWSDFASVILAIPST